MAATSFDGVALIVTDIEQALHFYREIVGAGFITDRPKGYCLILLFNLLIKSIFILVLQTFVHN